MRVNNCADCQRDISKGEIMFPVYWSIDSEDDPQVYFLCKECTQNELREGSVPGGRI